MDPSQDPQHFISIRPEVIYTSEALEVRIHSIKKWNYSLSTSEQPSGRFEGIPGSEAIGTGETLRGLVSLSREGAFFKINIR
jgi:hypothetical protein